MGEWVEDKTAVLRCEDPPDQCQTDQDCNEDLPGVCATNQEGETVDCAYCEDTGYFKQCTPGRQQYGQYFLEGVLITLNMDTGEVH